MQNLRSSDHFRVMELEYMSVHCVVCNKTSVLAIMCVPLYISLAVWDGTCHATFKIIGHAYPFHKSRHSRQCQLFKHEWLNYTSGRRQTTNLMSTVLELTLSTRLCGYMYLSGTRVHICTVCGWYCPYVCAATFLELEYMSVHCEAHTLHYTLVWLYTYMSSPRTVWLMLSVLLCGYIGHVHALWG